MNAAALVLLLVSCGAVTLQTTDIAELSAIVLERHDHYAGQDDLQDSARLRAELEFPQPVTTELADLIRAIADRHDRWVTDDLLIDPLRRETMLNSTKILRSMLDAQRARERR